MRQNPSENYKRTIRLVRKAERLSSRRLPDLGALSDRRTKSIRIRLTKILGDTTKISNEQPRAHRALGFLEALDNIDESDHAHAVINTFPVLLARYVEGDGKPDRMLSNGFFILGKEYIKYGQWELAGELLYYATITGLKDKKHARRCGVLALLCVHKTKDSELIESMESNFEDISDRVVNKVLAILHLDNSKVREALDPAWSKSIWKYGTLVGVLASEALSERLATLGQYYAALAISDVALMKIGTGTSEEWLRATVHQRLSVTHNESGNMREALSNAILAWDESQNLRYGDCDHRMRVSAWNRYLGCRETAISAAVSIGDTVLVAELLQKDRLQATVRAWLEETEITANNQDQLLREVQTSENIDEEASGENTVPQCLFTIMEDAYNSNALIPPLINAELLAQSSFSTDAMKLQEIEWWFGLSRYGKHIYWSLLYYGEPSQSGCIELQDETFFSSILDDMARDSKAEFSQNIGFAGDGISVIDPHYHLAEWGTADERMVSQTLARLIPSELRSALENASIAEPIRLVVSAGYGLEAIPWPIIQFEKEVGGYFRLLEHAVIRHWVSLEVENQRLERNLERVSLDHQSLELLVAIDDPRNSLSGQSLELKRKASLYIGHGPSELYDRSLGTKESIIRLFQQQCCGNPSGLFYYRGHAHSSDDPSNSCLELPYGEGDDIAECLLPAGEFFGRFADGSAWLPLPSRVVLSCCSSGSASLLGGEAVGLASACILGGGASEVIATSCDVYDCSFSTVFDDLLVESMMQPIPHDEALRTLQIRMYNEWKIFSVRGGINMENDVNFPHPMVWAMYYAL